MSTHNIPLSIYKRRSPEIIPNTIMSAAIGLLYYGLMNKFVITVVNEPSVFEPLKFYCMQVRWCLTKTLNRCSDTRAVVLTGTIYFRNNKILRPFSFIFIIISRVN